MRPVVFCRKLSRCVASLLILCLLLPNVLLFSVGAETALPQKEPYTWKQYDLRWGNTVLGIDPWTDSSGVRHQEETVAHAGCLITSVAILCKAHGIALTGGKEITPGTLAEALYDRGSCKYLTQQGAIQNRETSFSAVLPGVSFVCALSGLSNPAETVGSYLSDPDHVYFLVAKVNGGNHYVAVYGTSGKNVLICDPGYERTLLSEYGAFSFYVFEIDLSEALTDPGPQGESWYVQESVKVRSAPSLQSERIGSVVQGTVITVSETTEADGFLWGKIQVGWCALMPTDGSEVYCVKLTDTNEVRYHLRNGEGQPATQVKNSGTPLTISEEIPVYEGHYFLGWSENPNANAGSYAPGETFEEERSLDLYDVWMDSSAIYAFGIDVSTHQGQIDWQKVAASGIGFVLLRAGSTTGGKDSRFEENYTGARAAGLQVGSYFYCSSLTEAGVAQDVKTFTDALGGKSFDFPVYFDFETKEQANLGASALTSLCTYYLSLMAKTDYYAGVYASESWFRDLIDYDAIGKDRIWTARWAGGDRIASCLADRYPIHQYSGSGKIDGISGTVDLDVCYVNFPELISKAAPIDPPVDPPVDPIESKPKSDSGLTVKDGFLLGGKTGLTVREWRKLFDGDIAIMNGDTVLGDNEIAKTGCTVLTGSESLLLATRGDMNADGIINSYDYMILKSSVLGTFPATGAVYRSGCLLGDKISSYDYMRLKSYVLGTTKEL